MWLKKNDAPVNNDEIIAALVTPLDRRTDEEVMEFLTHNGAQHIKQLAAGIISVEAPRSALKNVESIARVEPKTIKQMHH